MKKTLGVTLLFLTLANFVYALDWGLNLTEVPLIMEGQTKLGYESSKAKLWLSTPWNGMAFRIETEGALSASTTELYSPNRNLTSALTVDLASMTLSGTNGFSDGQTGVLGWTVGRNTVTDMTGGWIVNSRWDGASANFEDRNSKAGASVGYSGLLLNSTGRVAGSPADLADQSDTTILLAPKRVFGRASLGLNELFFRQDWQTEVLGDWDLRPGDQAVHGAYLTFGLNGPLPAGLRERLYGTGSLRITPSESTSGFLAGGELSSTFLFLGSRLALDAVGAWGFGGQGFQALSGDGVADIVSLPTFHGASVKLDYSIRPVSKLSVGAKVNSLWRTSNDPPALSGFRTDSNDLWLGTEAGLYGSWNPTSELSFGWSGGIFVPQGGAFVSGTLPTELAVLTATIKL